MLVDYERAWLRLKRVIGEKRSHGQKDLAVAMADLEVECMLDNDNPPPEATVAQPKRATTAADDSVAGMPTTENPLRAQEASDGSADSSNISRSNGSKHPVR